MTFWITDRYVTPKGKRYSPRFGPSHFMIYLVECDDDPDWIPAPKVITPLTSIPGLSTVHYEPSIRRRALKRIKGIKIWREWGPIDKRSTKKSRIARNEAKDLVENPFLLRILAAAQKHKSGETGD
jgi:hypothetical protein